VSARYDAIADFYVGMVDDDVSDPVATALLELAGDVRDLRVLDLACGQGRVTRELARRGAASVVGIDLSSALLEKAVATAGVRYVHGDATTPDALAGETFDVVVSHFGLSDVDDLDGALATVARVLTRGGLFAFSIVHPCFPGWGEDSPSSWPPGAGYFREGWWLAENPGFRGKVGSSHRMLSTYVNALTDSGLEIDRVVEPEPTPGWLATKSAGEPVPIYLVVGCRRR
jgi:SAM-dependent methyltransferase